MGCETCTGTCTSAYVLHEGVQTRLQAGQQGTVKEEEELLLPPLHLHAGTSELE